MRSILTTAGLVLLLTEANSAFAQTPAEIFREMDSRKRASFADVDNFSQMKTIMGMCTLEHFEKESTDSEDGRGNVEYMRLVPMGEIGRRRSPDSTMANASPAELDAAATVLEDPIRNSALDGVMESELNKLNLPGGLGYLLTHPPSDEPWLSPMPSDMLGNYALMLRGAADGQRQDARQDSEAEERAKRDPYAEAIERTRVVGHEVFNSRPAIRLVAENLNQTQVSNGQEFTMDTLHLWIDAEQYVPLKMQIDGVAKDGSESRPMRIEREDMGYRLEPGCGSLNEPHRSVMRIAGVMNAEEEAQMLEAQAKMLEFKAQMASMPKSQQDMIMHQMGPQLKMMENMASGNGIEVVSLVVGMRCNAGLPTEKEFMQTVPGVAGASCIGFGKPEAEVPQSSSPPEISSPTSAPPAVSSSGNPSTALAYQGTGNPSGGVIESNLPGSSPQMTGDQLQAAQQACLEKKMAAAQASQKKKRGFGSLMRAVTRTAGSLGNTDIAQSMGDIYNANATAEDLASAAKDLGLTEDDIAACENPN